MPQVPKQINYSTLRKPFNRYRLTPIFQRYTSLGIKRSQEETGGNDHHHTPTIDVAEGNALTVVRAHGIFSARRLGLAVGPNGFTGLRVDGNHVTIVTSHCVKQPINEGGRGASADSTKTGTIPFPGNF